MGLRKRYKVSIGVFTILAIAVVLFLFLFPVDSPPSDPFTEYSVGGLGVSATVGGLQVAVLDYTLTDCYGCQAGSTHYPQLCEGGGSTLLCVKYSLQNVGDLPAGLGSMQLYYGCDRYGCNRMERRDSCGKQDMGAWMIENVDIRIGDELYTAYDFTTLNPDESITSYQCFVVPENPDIGKAHVSIYWEDFEEVFWGLTD